MQALKSCAIVVGTKCQLLLLPMAAQPQATEVMFAKHGKEQQQPKASLSCEAASC
jgi:hypothetical protein